MSDAKFHVIVKMDTITGCDVDQNLVISDIQLPITYSTVEFDFTNIGSVLGTIVDTIGTIALSFGQGIVVESMKKVIRSEIPSLLCSNLAFNRTKMEPLPVVANREK